MTTINEQINRIKTEGRTADYFENLAEIAGNKKEFICTLDQMFELYMRTNESQKTMALLKTIHERIKV